jgi:hypothetical protein
VSGISQLHASIVTSVSRERVIAAAEWRTSFEIRLVPGIASPFEQKNLTELSVRVKARNFEHVIQLTMVMRELYLESREE